MIGTFCDNPRTAVGRCAAAAVAAGLALWPLATFAQGDGSPANQANPAVSATKGVQGTPAVVLDDNGIESLLGKDVKNASGDKLGRVVDVLVSRDGTLTAAVIDFGGFLGVGTRKVAVSWSTLKFSDQGPSLDMTTDELRVTPEYRPGEPVVVVGRPSDKAGQPPPSPPPTVPEPPPGK